MLGYKEVIKIFSSSTKSSWLKKLFKSDTAESSSEKIKRIEEEVLRKMKL